MWAASTDVHRSIRYMDYTGSGISKPLRATQCSLSFLNDIEHSTASHDLVRRGKPLKRLNQSSLVDADKFEFGREWIIVGDCSTISRFMGGLLSGSWRQLYPEIVVITLLRYPAIILYLEQWEFGLYTRGIDGCIVRRPKLLNVPRNFIVLIQTPSVRCRLEKCLNIG